MLGIQWVDQSTNERVLEAMKERRNLWRAQEKYKDFVRLDDALRIVDLSGNARG